MKIMLLPCVCALSLVFSLPHQVLGQESASPKSDRPGDLGNESASERFHVQIPRIDGTGSPRSDMMRSVSLPRSPNHDDPILKALLENDAASVSVLEAYRQWMVQYYARQTEILAEQKTVIRNTNIISNIVCGVVHLALAVCFWVAISEYRHAVKLRGQHAQTTETQITLSLNEISVKTVRHGIVLFVLAIALYFLYLSIVYPITVVG